MALAGFSAGLMYLFFPGQCLVEFFFAKKTIKVTTFRLFINFCNKFGCLDLWYNNEITFTANLEIFFPKYKIFTESVFVISVTVPF